MPLGGRPLGSGPLGSGGYGEVELMGFHEVTFPDDISYGSRGGPGFSTVIIETDSGGEERIAKWSTPRHSYDVSYGVKTFAQLATLRTFYIARQGPAYAFRYKDFLDYTTATDGTSTCSNVDCEIGVGDGSTRIFQLRKKYTSGVYTRTRTITKPIEDTTVVALDSVNQSSGWSVNTSTGQVLFTTAPTSGQVVSAGCNFHVPVRFGIQVDAVLDMAIESFDIGGVGSIPLVEIKAEEEHDDEFYYGGAKNHGTITADVIISHAQGRVHKIATSGAGIKVLLPDEDDLQTGGPHFFIVNGGSYSFEIQSYDEDTVLALPSGEMAVIALGYDASGNKEWYAA